MSIHPFILRLLFIVFLGIAMFSCSSESNINNQLTGCDSLVINFNEANTNNIANSVSTTERKAIKKLVNFVDSKTTDTYQCGYDGNLMFYKKGYLAGDVAFNYSGDGCHHFIQKINDSLTSTVMSNEAVNFLKSLSQGKDWY